MKRKLIFGDEAKEQILEGAELLYKAVSTTLGPKGQNGVIEAYGEPIVTHDGVTVAKAINSVDGVSPGARVGIEMIKASSSKTNDNVGDGTTSSTVLAYHLIKDGMDKIKTGKNPMVLRRELRDASAKALEELKDLSVPVESEKAAIEVATISSENKQVGKEVGSMFHKLGKDGLVAVEVGSKPYTQYEVVEGYTFDRGVMTPMMIRDSRTQTTTMLNPAIIVAQQAVGLRDVAPLLQELYNQGKDGLVIVAEEFKKDLEDEAIMRADQFAIIGIKAPGFGEQRLELMKDLAAFVGTVPVGNKFSKKVTDLSPKEVGTCEKLVTTNKETVITGGQDVTDYIKGIEAKLKQTDGTFDRQKLEKRIAQLHAQVGQISVGGNTEMEAEETKYLIDDAVAATEAALKDGIVPGGATTYIELSRRLGEATDGEALLKEALLAPFKVLMSNAGLRYGPLLEKLENFGDGIDVMGEGDVVDLKEHGIIDPVTVIKQAITNATSVACSALTTGVIITTEEENNEEEE